MKTFTIDDIRSWNPCYDPNKYLSEDWKGTTEDILNNESIPFPDRLWVVLRLELVSARTSRLFAIWCYRDTLNWVKNPDPRSIEAANVAELFANGEVTEEQLAKARLAATLVDTEAPRAGYSDSCHAAISTAYASAGDWCDSARWLAASSPRMAASFSMESAIDVADDSYAKVAATVAAYSRQKEKLLEMLLLEAEL